MMTFNLPRTWQVCFPYSGLSMFSWFFKPAWNHAYPITVGPTNTTLSHATSTMTHTDIRSTSFHAMCNDIWKSLEGNYKQIVCVGIEVYRFCMIWYFRQTKSRIRLHFPVGISQALSSPVDLHKSRDTIDGTPPVTHLWFFVDQKKW